MSTTYYLKTVAYNMCEINVEDQKFVCLPPYLLIDRFHLEDMKEIGVSQVSCERSRNVISKVMFLWRQKRTMLKLCLDN